MVAVESSGIKCSIGEVFLCLICPEGRFPGEQKKNVFKKTFDSVAWQKLFGILKNVGTD